jgi:hypothetical protein
MSGPLAGRPHHSRRRLTSLYSRGFTGRAVIYVTENGVPRPLVAKQARNAVHLAAATGDGLVRAFFPAALLHTEVTFHVDALACLQENWSLPGEWHLTQGARWLRPRLLAHLRGVRYRRKLEVAVGGHNCLPFGSGARLLSGS